MFKQKINYIKCVGVDEYGQNIYGEIKETYGRIDNNTKEILKDENGKNLIYSGKIYIKIETDLSLNDKFIIENKKYTIIKIISYKNYYKEHHKTLIIKEEKND